MKKPKSERQKFVTRRFLISSREVLERALLVLRNLPIDPLRPLEIVAQEEPKKRSMSQQALLFAGPMTDIATQAWFEGGRQYSVEVLHEFCKRQFLPETFDPDLCLEGYIKWDVDPLGERILVGGTTQLTVRGYGDYLDQVFAFGGSLGVEFSADPRLAQGMP